MPSVSSVEKERQYSSINEPSTLIQKAFRDSQRTVSVSEKPSTTTDHGVTELFYSIFSDHESLATIPSLNRTSWKELKPGQLVSYTGMVESTSEDQEIFASFTRSSNSSDWINARYNDAIPLSDSGSVDTIQEADLLQANSQDSNLVLDERMGIRITEIPGLSEWMLNRIPSGVQAKVDIKCYAGAEKDIKILDTVEVYGMLQIPSLDNDPEAVSNVDNLPIIHAFAIKRTELGRLVERDDLKIDNLTTRENILKYIMRAVKGDGLVAEAILCVLLGQSVKGGSGTAMTGSVSLNLYRANSQIMDSIRKCIESLSPAVNTLSVTIDSLNSESYFPKNDGEKFQQGLCQVGRQSCLLLDETSLDEGKLNEKGCKNLDRLSKLISQHVVEFEYPFSSYDISTELNTISVGESKSLIGFTHALPLEPNEEGEEIDCQGEEVEQMRVYLVANRGLRPKLIQETANEIEDDFVKRRKAEKSSSTQRNVDEDWLSKRVEVAKLMAKSYGHSEIQSGDWTAAVRLVDGIDERQMALKAL